MPLRPASNSLLSDPRSALRLDRWVWGVPLLAALWGVAVVGTLPGFEAGLGDALRRAEEDGSGRLGARVEIDGRDARLVADRGLTAAARERWAAAARTVPGLRRLTIAEAVPIAMDPLALTVRVGTGGITLEGGIPGPEERLALVAALESARPGTPVRDGLKLATGADPRFPDALAAAIRLAGLLGSGEVSVTGAMLGADGVAAGVAPFAEAERLLANLPATVVPGPARVLPPIVPDFTWVATRNAAPDGDAVTLTGYAPSTADRRALAGLARSLLPETTVVDRLEIGRPPAAAPDLAVLARAGLTALANLLRGRFSVDPQGAALEGEIGARDLLGPTEGRLRAALPSGTALRVAVAVVPVAPFRFMARRDERGVTLSGYVPDEPERAALLADASRRFAGEPVIDRLHVADGAPDGFATVAGAGLDLLSTLADGEWRVVGPTVRLDGRSLYAESAARTRRRVAVLPPGWTGEAAIRVDPIERPLDPALCADLLADALRRDPVRFEDGRPTLAAAARPAVEALATLLRRCGTVRVAVVGLFETGAAEAASRALAEARARGLADTLAALDLPVALRATTRAADAKQEPAKADPAKTDPAKADPSVTLQVER